MKKNLMLEIALTACLLLAPGFVSAELEDYDTYRVARLSLIEGDVSVERASHLGLEKAEVNLAVIEGDKLESRQGRAEVQFGRRNFLRIDEYSHVEFVALPGQDGDSIKIQIPEGRAYLRINALSEEKKVEIHTPDASFYVLEEGLFRIEVKADTETEISVYRGTIEAAGESGSVLVRADERLVAASGQFNSDPEYFYAESDGFSNWNEAREELLAERSRHSYLPSAISEYDEELDSNGRWIYERPYGYVWVPVVHDIDWRPYHSGRWVWYPIMGWTWVPSERWGWCTSHYGRWHWRISLGWYWIPTARWSPAWVHWYWDDHYVGWCPLSYYNRPVVIIDNNFYGRYREGDYPVHSRALTVIHKDQLQSREVGRQALPSSKIGSLERISLRDQQPDIKPVVKHLGSQAPEPRNILSRPSLTGPKTGALKPSSFLSRKDVLAKPSRPETIRNIPLRKYSKDGPIPTREKPTLSRDPEPGSIPKIYRRSSVTGGSRETVSPNDFSRRPFLSKPSSSAPSPSINQKTRLSESSSGHAAPAPQNSPVPRGLNSHSSSASSPVNRGRIRKE